MAAACTKHPISSSIAAGSIHLGCTDNGCKGAASYSSATETCRDSVAACHSRREVGSVFTAAQIFNSACKDMMQVLAPGRAKRLQTLFQGYSQRIHALLLEYLQLQSWHKAGRQSAGLAAQHTCCGDVWLQTATCIAVRKDT